MVAERGAVRASGPPRRPCKVQAGVPGGGGSSPGLPSPPGDATPPGDAQTALIKKLNTAAAATASSSTSSPAPFHRYSAALLSSPAFHGLNPGAWKLPAKHYVRCIGI
ncbi:uncharacterized protein LOC129126097 isoform X1 [Agelaius phoeniceus]|uniref:uncharacterized protein LOC129126097 isoform X1 n=1 Tax=Agelaius phoeniceus TaxID=39638 RepID=UPI004054BDB5